jgi:anti-sigma regulatory factor (Ser/Thr protein kinase)
MRRERAFPLAATSATAARRFVVDALMNTGWADADLTAEVGVIVSELASNCIRHARTGFAVTVHDTRDSMRVEVTDTGAGVPALRSPGPLEPTGRGLQLVQALSDEWGLVPAAAGGKTVWFTISFRDRGTDAAGLASLGA